MSNKTFDAVGVSNLNGQYKVRYCNNASARTKVLHYHGHLEIQLFTLDEPCEKPAAVQHLLTMLPKLGSEAAREAVLKEAHKLGLQVVNPDQLQLI